MKRTQLTIRDAFRKQCSEDRGECDVDSSSHAAESADGSDMATGSSQQLIPAQLGMWIQTDG